MESGKTCKRCGPLSEDAVRVFRSGRWSCVACARSRKKKYADANVEKIKGFQDRWYRDNKADILAKMADFRKEKPEAARELRTAHYGRRKGHIQERVKRYKDSVKDRVLRHYSGGESPKCSQCPVTDPGCMTLDHIENDGSEHRKELGFSGNSFYLWIVKNGFPAGFQVLCMNCNYLKHFTLKGMQSSSSKRICVVHYSHGKNRCAECGEGRMSILTIDHVNGGGNAQRREAGVLSGGSFHLWLRNHGFPKGYQVLCFNCNFRKGCKTLADSTDH